MRGRVRAGCGETAGPRLCAGEGESMLTCDGRVRSQVSLFEEVWSDTCICPLRRLIPHCWRTRLEEVGLLGKHSELEIY
jgi:hypothetical protein